MCLPLKPTQKPEPHKNTYWARVGTNWLGWLCQEVACALDSTDTAEQSYPGFSWPFSHHPTKHFQILAPSKAKKTQNRWQNPDPVSCPTRARISLYFLLSAPFHRPGSEPTAHIISSGLWAKVHFAPGDSSARRFVAKRLRRSKGAEAGLRPSERQNLVDVGFGEQKV